jgi:hypothetical protein
MTPTENDFKDITSTRNSNLVTAQQRIDYYEQVIQFLIRLVEKNESR